MNHKVILACLALLLAGLAMPTNASHVQQSLPGLVTGSLGNWIGEEDQLVLCESNGIGDSYNPDAVAHEGFGGLCYASPFELCSTPGGIPVASDIYGPGYCGGNTPTGEGSDPDQWWCVDSHLIPPSTGLLGALGSQVPFTIRLGNVQAQVSSEGACANEEEMLWNDGHVTLFENVAWSGTDCVAPQGPLAPTLCLGNVPTNFGDQVWLANAANTVVPTLNHGTLTNVCATDGYGNPFAEEILCWDGIPVATTTYV